MQGVEKDVDRSMIQFVAERWKEWVNFSNVINRREEDHELANETREL